MKKMTIKIYISLMITLLAAHIGLAQENSRDFESWISVSAAYKLNKKWDFELEEQLRLKNNSSEVDQYFTQLDIGYKVFKKLDFGGGLRYIRNNDNLGKIQGYENFLRFHLDTSFKHKINKFSIKHRLRYQNKNELSVSESEGDYPNQYIRFKTTITCNIKNWKLDPVFAAEIFNHFQEGEENGFNKYRLTFGTFYKIKRIGKIGLFYRMEKELNVNNPKTTDIIKLDYTCSF